MTELTPEQRTEILERHLHDHGHVDPEDVDAAVAARRVRGRRRTESGPRRPVVARAWVDAEFRARLLADPVATLAEYHPRPCRSPCSRTRRRCTT